MAVPRCTSGGYSRCDSESSHALAAGAETVRVLGGWSSLAVVQRYVASSTDLKRAAVERLAELAS